MRKLIAVAILGLGVVSIRGQSQVDFRNAGPAFPIPADRKVYLGTVGNGAGLTGTNYGAGLWYVPGADNGALLTGTGGRQALNAVTGASSVFGFRAGTTTVPGTWNPFPNPFWLVLNDVAVWTMATLQVRVWDHVKYASFDAAFAAGEFGVSTPFNWSERRLDPPTGQYMDNLRAFAVISEPSTMALCLLCAAAFVAKVVGKFVGPMQGRQSFRRSFRQREDR